MFTKLLYKPQYSCVTGWTNNVTVVIIFHDSDVILINMTKFVYIDLDDISQLNMMTTVTMFILSDCSASPKIITCMRTMLRMQS